MTQQTVNDLREIFNSQITSWVKMVIGIIVFVFGIIAPFYGIKEEVALIKQSIITIEKNHLAHIQDLSQSQKEMSIQINELQKQLWIVANK